MYSQTKSAPETCTLRERTVPLWGICTLALRIWSTSHGTPALSFLPGETKTGSDIGVLSPTNSFRSEKLSRVTETLNKAETHPRTTTVRSGKVNSSRLMLCAVCSAPTNA